MCRGSVTRAHPAPVVPLLPLLLLPLLLLLVVVVVVEAPTPQHVRAPCGSCVAAAVCCCRCPCVTSSSPCPTTCDGTAAPSGSSIMCASTGSGHVAAAAPGSLTSPPISSGPSPPAPTSPQYPPPCGVIGVGEGATTYATGKRRTLPAPAPAPAPAAVLAPASSAPAAASWHKAWGTEDSQRSVDTPRGASWLAVEGVPAACTTRFVPRSGQSLPNPNPDNDVAPAAPPALPPGGPQDPAAEHGAGVPPR